MANFNIATPTGGHFGQTEVTNGLSGLHNLDHISRGLMAAVHWPAGTPGPMVADEYHYLVDFHHHHLVGLQSLPQAKRATLEIMALDCITKRTLALPWTIVFTLK